VALFWGRVFKAITCLFRFLLKNFIAFLGVSQQGEFGNTRKHFFSRKRPCRKRFTKYKIIEETNNKKSNTVFYEKYVVGVFELSHAKKHLKTQETKTRKNDMGFPSFLLFLSNIFNMDQKSFWWCF
jgi:hypothetical protein